MHWLTHFTGGDNGTGFPYLEWSGFLSIWIPPLLSSLAFAAVYARHHNCHARGCMRLGRFPAVEGGGWAYCRRHHAHGGEHR